VASPAANNARDAVLWVPSANAEPGWVPRANPEGLELPESLFVTKLMFCSIAVPAAVPFVTHSSIPPVPSVAENTAVPLPVAVMD
jgi:hypothetical protein